MSTTGAPGVSASKTVSASSSGFSYLHQDPVSLRNNFGKMSQVAYPSNQERPVGWLRQESLGSEPGARFGSGWVRSLRRTRCGPRMVGIPTTFRVVIPASKASPRRFGFPGANQVTPLRNERSRLMPPHWLDPPPDQDQAAGSHWFAEPGESESTDRKTAARSFWHLTTAKSWLE